MEKKLKVVLLIGSAPDASIVKKWNLSSFSSCVVINNAWQLTKDWNYLIHPEDFPAKHLPSKLVSNKKIITARQFVPQQNSFGGVIYAGGTMAFTAGYWVLGFLKPDVIAYLGCDMIYSKKTGNHFYGKGQADPLRPDITLQSLEAKSARLMAIAKMNNCTVINLSKLRKSRLLFPRITITQLLKSISDIKMPNKFNAKINSKIVKKVLNVEDQLGYMVTSGKYWESNKKFNPYKLKEIDTLWLKSLTM